MKVGEKVSVCPATFGDGAMEGKVIYVHPKEHYALVEFTVMPDGPKWGQKRKPVCLRECFLLRKKKK